MTLPSAFSSFVSIHNHRFRHLLSALCSHLCADLFPLFVPLPERSHRCLEKGSIIGIKLEQFIWFHLVKDKSVVDHHGFYQNLPTFVENLVPFPSVTRRKQGYSRVSDNPPSSCFMAVSSPSCLTCDASQVRFGLHRWKREKNARRLVVSQIDPLSFLDSKRSAKFFRNYGDFDISIKFR